MNRDLVNQMKWIPESCLNVAKLRLFYNISVQLQSSLINYEMSSCRAQMKENLHCSPETKKLCVLEKWAYILIFSLYCCFKCDQYIEIVQLATNVVGFFLKRDQAKHCLSVFFFVVLSF